MTNMNLVCIENAVWWDMHNPATSYTPMHIMNVRVCHERARDIFRHKYIYTVIEIHKFSISRYNLSITTSYDCTIVSVGI